MRTILFGAMGVMFIWVGMELNDSGYFIASGLFFICMNLSRFFKEEVKMKIVLKTYEIFSKKFEEESK